MHNHIYEVVLWKTFNLNPINLSSILQFSKLSRIEEEVQWHHKENHVKWKRELLYRVISLISLIVKMIGREETWQEKKTHIIYEYFSLSRKYPAMQYEKYRHLLKKIPEKLCITPKMKYQKEKLGGESHLI